MITQMLWAGGAGSAAAQPFYFLDAATQTIISQVDASAAWDITTLGGVTDTLDLSGDFTFVSWFSLSPDGTILIAGGMNGSSVYVWRQYELSTPWDISTATYDSKSYTPALQEYPPGAVIDAGGTRVYVVYVYTGAAEIRQYSLSTAWDISTASYVGLLDVFSDYPGTGGAQLVMNSTGTTLLMLGGDVIDVGPPEVYGTFVIGYTLSTPWDITTGTRNGEFRPQRGTDSDSAFGLGVSDDGATLVTVLGDGGTDVYDVRSYTFGTAWDVDTLAPDGTPKAKDLSAEFPGGIYYLAVGSAS